MFMLNFQILMSASSNPAMSKPLVLTRMATIPVPVIWGSLVMEPTVKVYVQLVHLHSVCISR